MKEKLKTAREKIGTTGLILVTVLIAVVLLTILLKTLPMPKKELPHLPDKRVSVEVIEARAEDLPDFIVLPGLVLADVDAQLAAETQGRVTELLAERGDAVKKGDVLVRLDSRRQQAVADAARTTHQDALRTLERFEKLSGTGAVSPQDLDDIRKAAELAAAQLREAEAALSYCIVKSPVDGIVNERYVDEGEYVLPAAPLFDVLSINPVRITADIPERNISSLKSGDTVAFEVLSLSDQSFSGTVAYISSKADQANNAFRMELTVPNTDGLLRPGMITSLHYRRGTLQNAIALPLETIIPQKGDNVVYTVRDNTAIRQLVRIRSILNQEAIIESGVEPGDLIVTRGNRMLNDGTAVEIFNAR